MTTRLAHRTIGREGFDFFRIVDPKTDAILGSGFTAEEAHADVAKQKRKRAAAEAAVDKFLARAPKPRIAADKWTLRMRQADERETEADLDRLIASRYATMPN